MANVQVAVRVRPLSKRETKEGGRIIVEVDDKVAKIRNLKVESRLDSFGDSREKVVAFGFDYCYWSVNPEDPQYASQDVVFQDLGTEVLSGAAKGYNICLFAYGQTGSGKTYTMLGTPASVGLTPRICEGLFIREEDCASLRSSCRIKVSFLEIYNERVRDLLKQSDKKKSYALRVREHPEMGPYVQGLSQHVVTNYKQVIQLLEEGIANRITAATHVHEASSRSHAIFTIHYTQAILENSLPSEIASKINLVDLAGSERADPSYCKDRITEGANINKSLVTLGIVISTLAQNSQVFSSCQSLNSAASNGGDSTISSSPSGTSGGGGPSRRQSYIPYRDSVLTWLLKDSLGGNSKTIMVATVSPAHTSYNETMSTLRYASNAKNIVNKPRVNEDASVKLIRELREEIERLKAMLLSFELRDFSSLNNEKDENLKALVLQNELKIDELTKDWTQKWKDWQALMEHYSVDINQRRAGVVINSSLPHLMALEDDVLSTGVVLYHLKEGTTKIGRIDSDQEQDIVLQGQWIERDHCTITSACGIVILRPTQGARCTVNGRDITASCRLTQGAVITLGKTQKFRFNHPAEAAVLRRRRQVAEAVGSNGSLEWLDLDGDITASRLGLYPGLWKERTVLEEQHDEDHQLPRDGETSHRAQIQQQQCYVEDLRQQILEGQIRAQKELEFDHTRISQQIKDNQQWLLREETWLASFQDQQQQEDCGAEKELEASVALDAPLHTDPGTPPSPLVQSQKRVVQLRLLWRQALRAAQRNIQRKKVSFQLERIIKKQRLLEAQRRLEQLRTLCWLQNDSTPKSPCQAFSSDATVPRPRRRSRWTSCSSLSLRRLCRQHLSQLQSVFLNWDPSTMLPPIPDRAHQILEKTPPADHICQAAAYPPTTGRLHRNGLRHSGQGQFCTARGASARKRASTLGSCLSLSCQSVDSQEMERVGKKPCQVASQGLESLCQLANKLKSRDGPRTLTPTIQTRRAKGPAASGNTQPGWWKEGNLGTHKAAKEAGCRSPYHHRPKQAAGHGKTAKTFQAESKPPPPSRTSKRHQKVLAIRVRDIVRKFSHLPHGSSLRRQHSAGDPLINSSSVAARAREKDNDLSDTDSNYSVDSLSYVYAEVPMELLKPEDPQGKWDLPEPENSESDNSQISEDSLAEKEYQSPKGSPGGSHPANDHGRPRTRTMVSVRGFTLPSDSGLHSQAHGSFSLDSLLDAKEELGEDQHEELFLGSADEMPAETFWHLQNSVLPVVDQEATCRPGTITHRIGARLSAILPMSSSFYLDPQFQPHCEQPKSEVEASYSKQASTLQGMQLSRESPLASMDSWFSCDSQINPSSPPGIVDSLCPSPNVQKVQPCSEERPGYWLNIEEVKPSGAETVLPCSSKLPQGSTELPCNARDVYATSASDTAKPSVWGTQSLLQPGANGIFQARGAPDTTQQHSSEVSHNSSGSSVLAASATSFTHVDSVHERDWAALQQKYLLELSHPLLEAIGEPRPAFFILEEDSSSLAEASGKEGDTQLLVGPGESSSLDFNNFPGHLSKIRHLRAEKEQDNSSVKLESASDILSTSEKEVSCNGAYSADLESLASGCTNVQVCAAENKIPDSMIEACEGKQNNMKECFQGSRKPGLMTSSDKYFFQKNACHNNVTIASKADHWPQDQAPLRKNRAIQPGQLSYNSHPHLKEEKADCQGSSKEVVGRHTDATLAFPSGPELYLHSAPWNPFPSSLQPPLLETFYVTKSRDALTETALEIPACREVWVPTPPPREAWGFGYNHQVLQKAYLKNNVPLLSESQNSKKASSQHVTAERSADLSTREVTEELGKCPGSVKEESPNSIYCFVTQNRHFLPSTSTKLCEFENQVEILNKKHSLSTLKEGEQATAQSHCNTSLTSSESGKSFLFVCESEAGGEEEQDQNAVLLQNQAYDINRQLSAGARSDFICKTTKVGLEKNMPEKTVAALKSTSDHHRVRSPVIIAQGKSPTHQWEGKNETRLLGKVLHPKDSPEEFKLPGTESTCERFQSVPCYQERNPSEYKGPRRSQEMTNSKEEPLGKKQNKRVNNADEMARLIRSVVQLENGILEMESKQHKQLHASHMPGANKEFMLQDQERADHVLRPGSSGNHLSFTDQSFSPREIDNVIFRDSEAGEMEVNSMIGNDPQVQKMTPNPFRSREYAPENESAKEHSHPAGLDRPTRDMCDSLGKGTTRRKSANISLHPRRMKALARALPLQPRPERPSEKDDKLVEGSENPKEQPCGLGSLEELETVKSFEECQIAEYISSSEPEDPKAQGRVEVMAMQQGGTLQEENSMVSLTQKLPRPSQHCMGTFFSQETVSPLLSQTDFSTSSSHQDLSNTLPSHSPRLPRSCLHASGTSDLHASDTSVDYVLDPTIMKIHNSPLVTGVGHQNQSGETKSHSPQGNVRGDFSMAYTAWCGSVMPMAMRSHGQCVAPESISPETEDWVTASTRPQDQGGDLRITLTGLSTHEGFGSEPEAYVQKEIRASSLSRVSRQLEKRVTFLLEEDNDQSREARQKAEEEAKDQGPASSAGLAPVSLPQVPDPELRLSDSSVHASVCLAILEELRQVKAQRKQLNDFATRGTVLPYYEASLKPECSSGVTSGPQWQMDQLVSDRTRNEGEAQGLHVPSLSAASEHLSADERKAQATPLCADSFQPLPNPETNRGPWHQSQTSSPDLGKRHSIGELRHFLGASEQFICHSSSSEIEKKKEAPRILPSVDPLASPAVEGAKRVGSEKLVSAFSSQAPCNDPGGILPGQSHLAAWETAKGMSSGSLDSSPEHQEPKSLDSTYGRGSGDFFVTAQGGKTAHFESQSAVCDIHNSASHSGQDHVQCFEASTGLEEGKAHPEKHAVLAGALRKVELEDTTRQCVKWKENVGSGLAEACRTGSKTPRPTPLPDQRPSPDPTGVREETPCQCPKETLDCFVFSGSPKGNRPLGSSSREEESRTISCQEPCSSHPSSHSTPDVRTSFLTHSAADRSSRSVVGPEEKVAEKKARTRLGTAAFPGGMCSKSPRALKDICVEGQNAQASQTKPEPLATQEPDTLKLSEGSIESELVVDAQQRCLENTIRCLSEKTQPSTKSRDHSCLNPQTKFVARLKPSCSPQVDSPWEEEEQQRDQASGGGEDPAQGRSLPPADEGDLDGCRMRDAGREQVAENKPPVAQTVFSDSEDPDPAPLGQTEAPQPAVRRPGQVNSKREPPSPRHRCSLPVIAIFSGPRHARSSPRPHFSVVSSSRSLQELNLSVEPPSPTDEDTQGPDRLWNPHLGACSSGKSVGRTCLKVEDCNQKGSSNLDNCPDDQRPLKPVTPPYPTSSTVSCMPSPNFMTSWMSGTLGQAQQGKPEKLSVQVRPENWSSQVDKGLLHFPSSDINPCVLPRCPDGPVRIGWKQYVFGSAVDVSCCQKPHGLMPPNMAWCSSMDNGLEGQNSPFYSHLRTYAQTRDLLGTLSIENAQSSNEAWEVWSSPFAVGGSQVVTGPEGVAPTLDSDKRPQVKSPTDAAISQHSELPLAEGSPAGPVDEIKLLYPSEAGCPRAQVRTNTFEQSTQTLGCRLHWSCMDIPAQPDASAVPACDLASWASMHNLSLRLSQLLHSTSELLGSLSQPSVAKKENTKSDTPDEAPQALMMDGATQTAVDKGSQTDLASLPLPLQAPAVKPQEINVILEVLDSGIVTMSQERRDVLGILQKREAEETAWKRAAPPNLHKESPHCGLQSPLMPSPHLKFEKAPLEKHLPSVSPPASPDAALPRSSQPEESSHLVINGASSSHFPGLPNTSESTWKPSVQKKPAPSSTLLVDRASSPILTLSASTQELGPLLGALTLSAPSPHPLKGHQKLDFNSDLALGAPRPPTDDNSQATDESGDSQRVESLGQESKCPLDTEKLFPELKSSCSPEHSSKLQVSFLGKPPQQLQPRTTTGVQSGPPAPPPRHRCQRLADSFVPEEVASPEHGLLSSRRPSQWQGRPEIRGESAASLVQPQPTLDLSSSRRGLRPLSPSSDSELPGAAGPQGSAEGPPQACQPEGLPCPNSQRCMPSEPQHHGLRDLPVHNKFSNWRGVQDGCPGGLGMGEELGASSDLGSGEQGQRPPQPSDGQSQDPEWSQREQIPLQVGVQKHSLSVELTEAKLHRGFGEADALLQALQSGTGEALAPEEPVVSTWEELYTRQKKAIETLRRERAERLQNFRQTRSVSPQKQLNLLLNRDLLIRELDLPSRRREYLQQLRKDVVETTRSPESVLRSAHPPSHIELMLRDYQRAREEAKVEIARARDRLRERTEQEKLRIRQQIISQLLKEEEKLHTLASASSLCTSSNGSLSSVITSGYNSSPALSGQLQSPEGVGDANLLDSRDNWIGDRWGRSAVRNSHLCLTRSSWKSSAYSRRTSLSSCCCSPSSLCSLGTCFSSSYQDLAKHIVDTSMADVMAACSHNLHNLFSHQATAGWNYLGEEQEVQLYYKEFSSTRHGFLGAGVVSQPLSHVWAAVSDPTLWPLYHKPIQTARLHQRVTNSISLVYLVCDTTLCALKQPRDFCCVCVEAKEGHLSIMAAQSVYDTSMPRPSRKMVRGEILPSAWILQPVTAEGKENTRVIFLAQVELGAPGFPPHLLSSFIKQQPLVVAKLASFLGS